MLLFGASSDDHKKNRGGRWNGFYIYTLRQVMTRVRLTTLVGLTYVSAKLLYWEL